MEKLPTILLPATIHDCSVQPIPPLGMHHKPPKGRSETEFERNLWRYFPGKIHTGLLVKRPDYDQPYVPDFAYLDPSLNLAIDIEVDEPYTHDTRQPLHYLGCPKDERRNQFFLDQGWVVIRFSEAQVMKSPASCCKAIASTIASMSGNNSIMAAFQQIPTLKPQPRWTTAQAQQLAEQNDRDQYLTKAQPGITAVKKRQRAQSETKTLPLISANLVFHCPVCGEIVRWQGHYVCCSNCGYDNFVL